MNEFEARRKIIVALGGTGPYNNELQFWESALTALNNGTPTVARNASEFWHKFADLLPDWTGGLADNQAIVSNGVLAGATVTGSYIDTVTLGVSGNTVNTITLS